jgi:hypothetical protein
MYVLLKFSSFPFSVSGGHISKKQLMIRSIMQLIVTVLLMYFVYGAAIINKLTRINFAFDYIVVKDVSCFQWGRTCSGYITFRAGIMFLIIMLSSCGGFFRYCYAGHRPQIIVHQITNYVPLPNDRSCSEERQGLVVSRFSSANFFVMQRFRA